MTGEKKRKKSGIPGGGFGAQRTSAWLLALLLAVLLLSNVKNIGPWLAEGGKIAFFRVLPSVFPYLILTGLICRTGLAERIGWMFGRPFGKLFKMSPACFGAVLLGLISGFPLGAKCACELYEQGLCSKKEAERLISFTDFCGPPFILAAVGQGVFGSVKTGWLLYFVQSFVSLLFGFFYLRPKKGEKVSHLLLTKKETDQFSAAVFTEIMADSVLQMLRIVGYVLFFSIPVGALRILGVPLFEKLPLLLPLMAGVLEISSGVSAITGSGLSALAISSFVVGFSGLSVMMQVWGFAKTRELSMKGYLWGRLICPPCMAVCSCVLAKIFGIF